MNAAGGPAATAGSSGRRRRQWLRRGAARLAAPPAASPLPPPSVPGGPPVSLPLPAASSRPCGSSACTFFSFADWGAGGCRVSRCGAGRRTAPAASTRGRRHGGEIGWRGGGGGGGRRWGGGERTTGGRGQDGAGGGGLEDWVGAHDGQGGRGGAASVTVGGCSEPGGGGRDGQRGGVHLGYQPRRRRLCGFAPRFRPVHPVPVVCWRRPPRPTVAGALSHDSGPRHVRPLPSVAAPPPPTSAFTLLPHLHGGCGVEAGGEGGGGGSGRRTNPSAAPWPHLRWQRQRRRPAGSPLTRKGQTRRRRGWWHRSYPDGAPRPPTRWPRRQPRPRCRPPPPVHPQTGCRRRRRRQYRPSFLPPTAP